MENSIKVCVIQNGVDNESRNNFTISCDVAIRHECSKKILWSTNPILEILFEIKNHLLSLTHCLVQSNLLVNFNFFHLEWAHARLSSSSARFRLTHTSIVQHELIGAIFDRRWINAFVFDSNSAWSWLDPISAQILLKYCRLFSLFKQKIVSNCTIK